MRFPKVANWRGRKRWLILLVVVAIPLTWLGWGLLKTRQRESFGNQHGTLFSFPSVNKPPLAWRICGASAVRTVRVSDEFFDASDLPWIRALFPEAEEVILVPKNDQAWEAERLMEERSKLY